MYHLLTCCAPHLPVLRDRYGDKEPGSDRAAELLNLVEAGPGAWTDQKEAEAATSWAQEGEEEVGDETNEGVPVGVAGAAGDGDGGGGDDQGVAEFEAKVGAGTRGDAASTIIGSTVTAPASGGGGRAPSTKRDKRKAAKKRREESDVMMKQVQETIVQGEAKWG